jgi:hypothetical protein
MLSDGVARYSVALTIGGQEVEAALDTGSTGLRLAPGAAPVALTQRRESYAYFGGVRLDGVFAYADVTLGGLNGRVGVLAANKIGCTARRLRCSAALLPSTSFGLMGDGLAGEGFKAVLGVGLAGRPADNPLRALGVQRWIISLPRPDQPGSGRLVINPSDSEIADFTLVPLQPRLAWRDDATHDAIDGCLEDQAIAWRLCGPILLDTGADRINVLNTDAPTGLAGPLVLAFPGLRGGAIVALDQHNGAAAVVTGLDPRLPRPIILAGVAPYLAYDVLYDAERSVIGLRPRGS